MKNFINDKLTIMFLCKDDTTMVMLSEIIAEDLIKLTPMDKPPVTNHISLEKYMKSKGLLSRVTDEKQLDKTVAITITTWFGNYILYSCENGYSSLLGLRTNVVVLDDYLSIDRDTFGDLIEPIASEQGSMVLMSTYLECKEMTKYTQQPHYLAHKIQADLVYKKFLGVDTHGE